VCALVRAQCRQRQRAANRRAGAAFQIADDVPDHEGDEAELGKRAGKDAARNKATYVSAFGFDHARAPWRRWNRSAAGRRTPTRVGIGFLH
jgi:geranylgeranyl pyrophosphate synthase